MRESKKTTSLRVELDAPASPQRVLATVKMLTGAVEALDPDLPDGAVTLVVSNFDLRSELRSNTLAGSRVVRKIGDVFEHPEKAVAEPGDIEAAICIARGFDSLGDAVASVFRGTSKKPIAKVSARAFAAAMKDAAKRAKPSKSHGDTRIEMSVYTPIMRFGRNAEDAKYQARIMVFGDIVDADVPDSLFDTCASMTASDDHVMVKIEGRWESRGGGSVLVGTKIVDVDVHDRSMTSSEFVDYVRENASILTPVSLSEAQERLRVSRETD